MPRGKSVEIDLETAHRLKAQGIPTAEIARQLHVPVSTLKDQLKRTLPAKPTDVYNGSPTEVHKRGATNIHIDIPVADLAEFQEVLV
jgi:orotate phosphoribosyltransferase-like protein